MWILTPNYQIFNTNNIKSFHIEQRKIDLFYVFASDKENSWNIAEFPTKDEAHFCISKIYQLIRDS